MHRKALILMRAAAMVAVLWSALLQGTASAEVRALLVGVAGYPQFEARRRLAGPPNDVQRMRRALLARGAASERVELLADGVAGAVAPTRAAIIDALARLATQARRGDTVVLMFAGHGSLQPAATTGEPPEPIFLPLDVAGWDGTRRQVTNAITSRELRDAVDRIAAQGAFVWAVFDACHSARLVRGEAIDKTSDRADDSSLAWRQVSPQQLGVPAGELARAGTRRAAPDPVSFAGAAGQTAFFYAAQASEVTPELKLPTGTTGARVHGLFSHVLLQALERSGPMTYRQLAQQVLASYAVSQEAQTTPLFSGNALDAPLLGGRGSAVRQWRLERDADGWWLPAGALSGIGPGAVLAVLPDALADETRKLGHLRVAALQADRATLEPVAHAALPAPAAGTLRTGQVLRLASNPPSLGVRLAWRRSGCEAGCALSRAVARLQRDGVPGVAAEWANDIASVDVWLEQRRDRIVLHAPGVDDDLAAVPLPAASDEADATARLAAKLHTVARSRNLLRIAARMVGDGARNSVVATLERRAAGGTPWQSVDTLNVAALRNGDALRLTVDNPGASAVDLTVLYLDANHGVAALFPSRQGETNRIEPGARQIIDGIDIAVPPAGLERLLLITAPSRRFGESRDYSFLAQPALSRVRAGGEEDLFADAAFASHVSRGDARPAAPAAGIAVQLFTFDVRR
ncbi:MAG: caspase family protein [Rubrivivax sp.]